MLLLLIYWKDNVLPVSILKDSLISHVRGLLSDMSAYVSDTFFFVTKTCDYVQ